MDWFARMDRIEAKRKNILETERKKAINEVLNMRLVFKIKAPECYISCGKYCAKGILLDVEHEKCLYCPYFYKITAP